MSILGYKTIKLYKTKVTLGSSSEEYEADITDEKMQEIATALGCNVQVMVSGCYTKTPIQITVGCARSCQIISR